MGKFLIGLERLAYWFHRQKRVLPWRNQPTVYRVWISEIMLQQTQVAAVIPYFERFLARFPTVESLASAKVEDVLFQWSGLGYYSRARNLHQAAIRIVEKGYFPRTREEWLEMPGVGNYTAGAILSISGNHPEAILDGNVERVLSRVRRVTRHKGDSAFKERLWKLSKIFVESGNRHGVEPSVLNQALMELGATLCSPKKPKCGSCPMSDLCQARANGDPEAFPPKKKPKEWIQMQEKAVCVVNSQKEVLLRQRSAGEWRSGLWDLLDEEPEGLLQLEYLGEVETRHVVTRHKITRKTRVWRVVNRAPKGKVSRSSTIQWKAGESSQGTFFKWVSMEAPEVATGSALKRTLKEIQSRFGV